MKAVIQRVKSASVEVGGKITGKIGIGLLIFLGVSDEDGVKECDKLADKIAKLRIFSDGNDKINLSADDVNGDVLVVSQFTLYADCRKGNRPSFVRAGKPEHAENLYTYFSEAMAARIKGRVENGVFGADMKVSLLNDGPFTVIMECMNGEILP
ncbi:D-aminoacyl-tRNA deacylase [Ruminococcus sp. Marseille-P6503]|uniref:D-aminoacyl-tRNA deacylase n=1 Tax=Ruminococcus sp. Marseille-P6503 TaxID=2364796 RepID=UPI000F528493|nr:D-aminoacyl-tRNA deacylase [Ruminococcus sp. Marseille-P6503]